MIHTPAFYKLLGIPESVVEPTAYDLLRLDPRMVTEALVDSALKERKALLRQNIPGPQFIPIVSLIELELDKAATILRDERLRQQYNERLLKEARKRQHAQDSEARQKLVAACREAVRSMVDADGCLPDYRREELDARLDELGLPREQIRYVIENIPRPSQEQAQATPEQRREASDEALRFFVAAIEEAIEYDLLDEASEAKLMRMAERFGIPAELATPEIDERLLALGARRGERDESPLASQFKLQVLAMHPTGRATELERRRLLSLAAAQGLSARQAEKVLRDYLPSVDGADANGSLTPGDPLGALRELAVESAVAPELPPRQAPRRAYAWYLISAVMVLVLAIAAIGVWQVVISVLDRRRGGPGPAPSPTPGGQTARRAVATSRPALLEEAFGLAASPEKVRKLMDEAGGAARAEAMLVAADLLVATGTPREEVLVDGLYKALLYCPPAGARAQHAAVGALIKRLQALSPTGSVKPDRLSRAVQMLASLLFLRRASGVAATDAEAVETFLQQCEREWKQSRLEAPTDPANDPKRLAYAVLAGGSLKMYAARADRERFAAVTARLAKVAANPQTTGAQEALAALREAAAEDVGNAEASRAARLALCDVIRSTPDRQIARRAHAALALALDLTLDDPLRIVSLADEGERETVSAGLRDRIGPEPATAPTTAPAASQPTTRPVAPQPKPAAFAMADFVRKTWGDQPNTRQTVADVTVTMLACAERVAAFASQSDALARELRDVLAEPNARQRTARLTKWVRLATSEAPEPATASTLDDEITTKLQADVRSSVMGIRNRAVEQLRVLDDPAATMILLDRLSEIVDAVRPDLPAMNRILDALGRMSDPGIPVKLASLIQPARTNYAAHRIVMTLLAGSGYAGRADVRAYRLPINHDTNQRAAAADIWKNAVMSCPWGPTRMAGEVIGSTAAPPAWRPDEDTDKLLGALLHYSKLTGQMLQAYRPAVGGDVPVQPDLRPTKASMAAPIREKDLVAALELVANELIRLARARAKGKAFAVKLDMIALTAKSRGLACETPLQRAAVQLDTAGRALEVLVAEHDRDGSGKKHAAETRARRDRAVADVDNVLDEMREHCYYNLILLGLLARTGP